MTDFSTILARKMKNRPMPTTNSEIHSVDEVISPEFGKVFGHGSIHQKCRGLRAYGVA